LIESTRLKDWDYSSRGWYFVTICTFGKRCTLGKGVGGTIVLSRFGVIAESEMRAVSGHYPNVYVDRFVVMPNHVHSIIVIDGQHHYSPDPEPLAKLRPRSSAAALSAIVGSYKAGVSRICHATGLAGFAWQTRFYEQILRSNAAVNAVRDYIDRNPENWLSDPDNQDGAAA
jgi:putative transposase